MSATQTDAAGNTSSAGTRGITVDTIAPTAAHTSGAYTPSTDTWVLTGTNYNTLLETSETATTDIKARLDWTKLSWDINGDGATTADVSFALSDISTAMVTDSTHLTIVLTSDKGVSLEATDGYAGEAPDTLDITAGFAKDGVGNAATTDAVANGALALVVPYVSPAGNASIDLGSDYGWLRAPVQVEGAWYYYWDRNGIADFAEDRFWHDELDAIFKSTLSEVNAGTVGTGTDTTDLIRYATLNGVKVALPTANGGEAYPRGIDNLQLATIYSDAGVNTNGTTGDFNELLAIWDAYNGAFEAFWPSDVLGAPSNWQENYYWSATPSGSRHAALNLASGDVWGAPDDEYLYVALQVL